ncbi:MAG: HlyD family efflux transporter periplasmic adaptor subunit [Saprospiraceae bacterium]|nr:HlyD family efflux transporter periplasmic adaptor subunit [Lewinella sp.]
MRITNALFFFFILLLSTACRSKDHTDVPSGGAPDLVSRAQIVAGHPAHQSMQESLSMNAVTTYTKRENIRATTTGYVEHSTVNLGDQVNSGQRLFTLKTREAAVLGEEILRDSNINITGLVPVIAKNSGVITQVFFQEGDYVAEGEVLAELTKPSSLAVKLYVPYEYNALVRSQKRVSVQLPDGERINGTIGRLLPSEDVVSQTTPYLVSLSPYRFLPENLNLTVTVPTQYKAEALVVPVTAVQSNEEQTDFWIMELVNDTLAVRRPVKLGMRSDSLIEIKNTSLVPASRIVVQGAYGLPDTAAVTPVTAFQ